MKKRIGRAMPYVVGVFWPLLFAVRAPQGALSWKKLAIWLAVQILLTAALDVVRQRKGLKRSLTAALQIWLAVFVQVFLRCLIERDLLGYFDRTPAGFLFLYIVYAFVLILCICFSRREPLPKGKNVFGLAALLLIMPLVLMVIGVFNRTFLLIGLGWGLLVLMVLILRMASDPGALPEDEEFEAPPDREKPGYGLRKITGWLAWLGVIATAVLVGTAVNSARYTPREADEAEIAYYSTFEMDVEGIKKAADTDSVKAAVLSFCEFEKSEEVAGNPWNYYKAKGLEAYLPEAQTIISVEDFADTETISIYYLAKDGKEVRLTYGIEEDGKAFAQNGVYDPKTDICYEGSEKVHRLYYHFRNGS